MSLAAGSVTVDDDGVRTGSGMALALYDAQLATMASFLGQIDESAQLESKRGMATFCEALADGVVNYITANAEVTVTVSTLDGGLQRTPSPNNPNEPTLAPSVNRTLSGTLT